MNSDKLAPTSCKNLPQALVEKMTISIKKLMKISENLWFFCAEAAKIESFCTNFISGTDEARDLQVQTGPASSWAPLGPLGRAPGFAGAPASGATTEASSAGGLKKSKFWWNLIVKNDKSSNFYRLASKLKICCRRCDGASVVSWT
jgi:hypothetical protein